jgi:integrase/recombinase XerC
VDDKLIKADDNPASKVDKPRRLPSTRRALSDAELAEVNQVAASTGDDPELDALILRLHTETACRRAGALALRPRDGHQITARRYDGLWVRIGREVPWVYTQDVSTHWLRYTTLTWVERNFGFAIAHAYAGHTDSADDRGVSVTSTYVRGTLPEIATVLAALTGEPHPLALAVTEGGPA